MSLNTHFWSDLNTHDFAGMDKSRAVAVLPLAATEQHGPHLPLSVDTDIVNAVIARSVSVLQIQAPSLPVYFLPTQAVGLSPEHAAFAGTLTLKPETLIRLWTDIAESVKAAGIHKLVLFNAHGGHVGAMDVAARALLVAEQMLQDGKLAAHVDARYAGWKAPLGQQIMGGGIGLDTLAEQVLAANRDTAPVSGRQEYLENLLNSYL